MRGEAYAISTAGSVSPHTVHVWIARTHSPMLHDAVVLLSAEERTRHKGYINGSHRDDFAAAHALKRIALAQFLPGALPPDLRFGRHATGKPYLIDAPVFFSMSHSRGFVAIAVSREGDVGVDVEVHGCETSARLVAKRTMTGPEQAAIAAAGSPLRDFYERWTIKESLVKATGHGLSTDFQSLCTERDMIRPHPHQGQIGDINVYWRSGPSYSYAASHIGAQPRFIEHVM